MVKGFRFMKLCSSQERYHLRELFLKYPDVKQIKNEKTGDEYDVLSIGGYYLRLFNKTKGIKENFYKPELVQDRLYTIIHADVVAPTFGQNSKSAVDARQEQIKQKREKKVLEERKRKNDAIIRTLRKPKK